MLALGAWAMALLMLVHMPASRAVSAHGKLRPALLWPPARPLPPGHGPSLGPSHGASEG